MIQAMTRRAQGNMLDLESERRVPVVLEPLAPLPGAYVRQGLPCKIYFGMRGPFSWSF